MSGSAVAEPEFGVVFDPLLLCRVTTSIVRAVEWSEGLSSQGATAQVWLIASFRGFRNFRGFRKMSKLPPRP